MDNQELLKQLLIDEEIAIENTDFLWQAPAALPSPFAFDRVEGMLLGLAAGDALGNTSESMTPEARERLYGQIADYLPNKHANGMRAGLPSDDTQMAFWMIEVLLEDGGLVPEALARRFTQEQIFGIGGSVRSFLKAYKDQGVPWQKAGARSAGNGALMRIAPVVLPHLKQPSAGMWADAALAGMVTHNDRASNAASVAFTAMLWDLFGMEQPPDEDWWLRRYLEVAGPLEGSSTCYTSRMPGIAYAGPIWRFVQEQVTQAIENHWSTRDAANTWGSGAYLLETIPSAVYILMRYAHDPEQAIIRAVNDTWDNDTVAAIIGSAVGALHGKSALPSRWIKGLLGRTNDHNDGHIFELIDQAKAHFWEHVSP